MTTKTHVCKNMFAKIYIFAENLWTCIIAENIFAILLIFRKIYNTDKFDGKILPSIMCFFAIDSFAMGF
ncbi:hypothetical protein BC008_31135 [Mastigocoleus testarum BC008]|uniref:Uncharacterized protein n=1 Tax=Mastigocoleus testarum BC008 TaxID=371196 RepID=A0A0V7ZU15_9CYAN|nr:hypothetical protein BC008_31135 [Mastigocoleus testarum BC008]